MPEMTWEEFRRQRRQGRAAQAPAAKKPPSSGATSWEEFRSQRRKKVKTAGKPEPEPEPAKRRPFRLYLGNLRTNLDPFTKPEMPDTFEDEAARQRWIRRNLPYHEKEIATIRKIISETRDPEVSQRAWKRLAEISPIREMTEEDKARFSETFGAALTGTAEQFARDVEEMADVRTNPLEAQRGLPILVKTLGERIAAPELRKTPFRKHLGETGETIKWWEEIALDPTVATAVPSVVSGASRVAGSVVGKALMPAVAKAAPELAPAMAKIAQMGSKGIAPVRTAATTMEAIGRKGLSALERVTRTGPKAISGTKAVVAKEISKALPTPEKPADAVVAMRRSALEGGTGAVTGEERTLLKSMEETPGALTKKQIKESAAIHQIARDMELAGRTRLTTQLRGAPAKTARGHYDRWAEGGALADPSDLEALTHEFGHDVEKRLWGLRGAKEEWAPISGELEGLAKTMYPDLADEALQREGFGQFMWAWMTRSEKVGEMVPNAARWWNDILARNPKFARQMTAIQDKVNRFRSQGPRLRILRTRMQEGEKLEEPVLSATRRWMLKRKEEWIDRYAVVEQMEKEVGIRNRAGKMIDPEGTGPLAHLRAFSGSAPSQAAASLSMEQTDLVGNWLGPSMKEIMERQVAQGHVPDFMVYLDARHAVQSNVATGRRVAAELDDAVASLDFYDKSPEFAYFRTQADLFTNWHNNELSLLKGAGVISEREFDDMLMKNPFFVSLRKAFPELEKQTVGAARRVGSVGKPLKVRGESTRVSKGMYEAVFEYSSEIRRRAIVGHAEKALAEVAEREGAGRWIRKVGTDPKYSKDPNTISLLRKNEAGEVVRHWYAVQPDLYRVLQDISPYQANFLTKWFMPFAKVQRLGATALRPGFAAANTIRDLGTFLVQSAESGWLPKQAARWARGQFRAIGGAAFHQDPMWRWGKAAGIDISTFHNADKAMKSAKEMIEQGRVAGIAKNPVQALREMLSTTEMGPRLAEAETLMRRHGVKPGQHIPFQTGVAAMEAARDVTVNFTRAGTIGQHINQIFPFFNPRVQGAAKFVKSLRQHPVRTTFRALGTITVPTLALWWLRKDDPDYQDEPHWLKAFWTLKSAEGNVARIPVPFEWGVFKIIPEAILNYMYRKDPEGFKESELGAALTEIAKIFTPVSLDVSSAGSAAVSLVGNVAGLGPAVQVGANRAWHGGRINPRSTENLVDEAKVASYTSATARKLSDFLAGWSTPAEIDYMIGAYTGGIGHDTVAAIEAAAGHPLKPEALQEVADTAIVGRFFARQLASRSVDEMYTEYAALRAKEATHSRYRRDKKDELAREYELTDEDKDRYSTLDRAVSHFGRLMDRVRNAKTKTEARHHRREALKIARKAMGR